MAPYIHQTRVRNIDWHTQPATETNTHLVTLSLHRSNSIIVSVSNMVYAIQQCLCPRYVWAMVYTVAKTFNNSVVTRYKLSFLVPSLCNVNFLSKRNEIN